MRPSLVFFFLLRTVFRFLRRLGFSKRSRCRRRTGGGFFFNGIFPGFSTNRINGHWRNR
ncbi:hypothetical protein V6Z12_D08G121700 [Gossypium hirsutum]